MSFLVKFTLAINEGVATHTILRGSQYSPFQRSCNLFISRIERRRKIKGISLCWSWNSVRQKGENSASSVELKNIHIYLVYLRKLGFYSNPTINFAIFDGIFLQIRQFN